MLQGKKALHAVRLSVSWTLLPLLADYNIVLLEALHSTYKVKRWQADARECCPVRQSRINVDWLTFDPQMFVPLFPRLKEGILRDVFIQKAIRKNLGGWRIPTRDRTGTGSNSSEVEALPAGLRDKPLRGLRVNGSVLCISIDLIRSTPCHGNGLVIMRI